MSPSMSHCSQWPLHLPLQPSYVIFRHILLFKAYFICTASNTALRHELYPVQHNVGCTSQGNCDIRDQAVFYSFNYPSLKGNHKTKGKFDHSQTDYSDHGWIQFFILWGKGVALGPRILWPALKLYMYSCVRFTKTLRFVPRSWKFHTWLIKLVFCLAVLHV